MSHVDERKICEQYHVDTLYTDPSQVKRFADGMHHFYSAVTSLYSQVSDEHSVQFKDMLQDAIRRSPEWTRFILTTDYDETQRTTILEFLASEVQSSAANNLRGRNLLQ